MRRTLLLIPIVIFGVLIALWRAQPRIIQQEQSIALTNDQVTPVATTLTQAPTTKPTAKATLTDQEFLEYSRSDDRGSAKRDSTNSQIAKFVEIPTTRPTPGRIYSDTATIPKDDARSLFLPLDSNNEGAPQNSGVLSGRSAVQNNANDSGQIISPTPTATPDNSLPWVSGQARGYAMLYAMQPQARSVVEKQVQALLDAKVREPYISILIDGTFNQDFEYLRDIISRLSTQGRKLTLGLYISNGPTMRIWNRTPIRAAFSTIEPSDFRRRIKWQDDTRTQYAKLVDQARQLFEFNLLTNRENKNIAIPMLEDNLDRESYQAMRQIAGEQLSSIVKFIRNPCEGCYSGNNGEALGDALEEHRIQYFPSLSAGDGFTLDGLGFYYPDTNKSVGLNAQQLKDLVDQTLNHSLAFFGLWRHAWQGVVPGTENPHPNERRYVPSTDEEIDFEISILRRGLDPEEQASDGLN